ncbi:MAG: DMT family transporter [Burkholderiaceae bacterium]|nr:DMT family transporter [Burkholderiaceae bacterium]
MDHRQPLDARATVLMLALCLTWSLQQILLKATADAIAPTLQIALRSGVAALLVWLFMRWRGLRLPRGDGSWRPGLVVGALFAFEYLLVGESLHRTSAAHVVVFLYSAPVFAALGLHWKLPSERLAPLQWLGIALAFAGIAIAFLGSGAAPSPGATATLLGDFLALAAGAAWGATTVAIRTTRLATLPAAQTLFYQLVVAFALLMPAALLLGQTRFEPTPLAWAGLAFQSVLVCFVSFLVWFWLLTRYLASRLGVFTFLTPLFGVVFGAWLLGEAIEPGFLAGALTVLAGVLLVSSHGWLRALRP